MSLNNITPIKPFTLDLGLPFAICDSMKFLHGARSLSPTEEAMIFESTRVKTKQTRTGFLRFKTKNNRIINIQAYCFNIAPDRRLGGSISIGLLQRMNLFITGTRASGYIINDHEEVLFETTNTKLNTLTLVLNEDDIILPTESAEYFSF